MLSSRPIHLHSDGPQFPTKTPGRGLKNRAENAYAGGGIAMTIHGKGKNAMAPKTPFQPNSVQPQRLFKDQKEILTTGARPLGDKTPMPNRLGNVLFQTPGPQKNKLSKLVLVDAAPPTQLTDEPREEGGEGNTPDSVQRPSSMRKHIKHPRISGTKNFQTPMNKGNHWDISEGDIVVPDAQTLLQETIAEDEDDFDEVEYGPPNTLDLPFQPPFDFELPDYKEVGKSLRQLAMSGHCFETFALPEPEMPASELENVNWNMMPLAPLESDNPFELARREGTPAPKPIPASQKLRSTANAPTGSKPRPQSSLARLGTNTKASMGPPAPNAIQPTSRAANMRVGSGSARSGALTITSKLGTIRATSSSASSFTSTKPSVTSSGRLVAKKLAPVVPDRVPSRPKPVETPTILPVAQQRGTLQSRPHTSQSLSSKRRTIVAPLRLPTTSTRVAPRSAPDAPEDIVVFKDTLEKVLNDDNFLFDV